MEQQDLNEIILLLRAIDEDVQIARKEIIEMKPDGIAISDNQEALIRFDRLVFEPLKNCLALFEGESNFNSVDMTFTFGWASEFSRAMDYFSPFHYLTVSDRLEKNIYELWKLASK